MAKKQNAKAGFAGAHGSASGPQTGYWLQHMENGRKNGRFVLTLVSDDVETILDTGSGVLVLRALRKLGLGIPDIMGGPKCFSTEWVVRW
jgi:hypothetical protein